MECAGLRTRGASKKRWSESSAKCHDHGVWRSLLRERDNRGRAGLRAWPRLKINLHWVCSQRQVAQKRGQKIQRERDGGTEEGCSPPRPPVQVRRALLSRKSLRSFSGDKNAQSHSLSPKIRSVNPARAKGGEMLGSNLKRRGCASLEAQGFFHILSVPNGT